MGNELFGGRDVGNTPSFKEQAYALIKDAILFNRFRVGAIYSQEAICTELGISRTPVREALLELGKKMATSLFAGEKGFRWIPVSQTMAHDILEARLYAERVNAELAAVRATQQERDYLVQTLKDLQENLEGRDGQLLYRVDHRFTAGLLLPPITS